MQSAGDAASIAEAQGPGHSPEPFFPKFPSLFPSIFPVVRRPAVVASPPRFPPVVKPPLLGPTALRRGVLVGNPLLEIWLGFSLLRCCSNCCSCWREIMGREGATRAAGGKVMSLVMRCCYVVGDRCCGDRRRAGFRALRVGKQAQHHLEELEKSHIIRQTIPRRGQRRWMNIYAMTWSQGMLCEYAGRCK